MAFIQASLMGAMFIWSRAFPPSVLQEAGVFLSGSWLLLDLAILLVLGVLAYRRHVAAAYALVLYQGANIRLALADASQPMDVFLPIVIGVLYAVGAYHLRQARGKLTWRGRAATAAAAAAILLLALNAKTKTPLDHIAQESESRMRAVPGLRERFESDPAGARALGRELAIKGARRLSPPQLIERARLLAVILSQLDDHNCAEQFRGGRGDLTQALNKLDNKTLRAWYDLALTAMIAEHLNTPAPQMSPSNDEISDAWEKLQGALPAEDSTKLLRLTNEGGENLAGLSDTDVCWVFRTLVTNIPKVDPAAQEIFARTLVAGGQ